MNGELNSYKKSLGVKWIRGESGSTFLCPADAVDNTDSANEEQLRALCVEESLNPQND